MSRRPPVAAADDSRPRVSRRLVVTGPPAALAAAHTARAEPDPAADAGAVWLARHAEIRRLDARWGRLEHQLMVTVRALGADVSAALAEGSPAMEALDRRIRALEGDNARLRDRLAALPATTPAGVAAKLQVAAAELWPQDQPEAHRLVVSAIQDLAGFTR